MKPSSLTRKTPLRRTTALTASPLARSSVHAHQARKVPKRGTSSPVPPKVRAALRKRSGGWCEIATRGCTGLATEFAHRKKNGAGGRHGDAAAAHHVLSNALDACHNCHQIQGHREPAQAYANGWMLREHQDPARERVLRRGVWRLLGDDGSVMAVV